MFCPFCGKQNKDDVVFCAFCGKAVPPKKSLSPEIHPQMASSSQGKTGRTQKPRLSFGAIKAVVTVIMVTVLVIVVLLIYYPTVFPWNW